jgi:hypothetical protein
MRSNARVPRKLLNPLLSRIGWLPPLTNGRQTKSTARRRSGAVRRPTKRSSLSADRTILVALVLAAATALTSMPGGSSLTVEVMRWLQAGTAPEADLTAGAIGEVPSRFLGP